MACDISLGRIEPCKDSVGGLDAVYFVNDGAITGFVMDTTDADVIASVEVTPDAYKYDLKGNSTFETTINSSTENGTSFFEQTLTLTLKKLDINSHKELKLLTWGKPKVIVKDNNGNFFLMGKEHGAEVTGGTVVTGGAMGDLSGYTLTLSAMERVPANFIDVTDEAGLTTAGFTIVAGV
jgi:hypothetical protein